MNVHGDDTPASLPDTGEILETTMLEDQNPEAYDIDEIPESILDEMARMVEPVTEETQ